VEERSAGAVEIPHDEHIVFTDAIERLIHLVQMIASSHHRTFLKPTHYPDTATVDPCVGHSIM
jgi:hypothetical protein